MRRLVWAWSIGVVIVLSAGRSSASELGGRWRHAAGNRLILTYRCWYQVPSPRPDSSNGIWFNLCRSTYAEVQAAARAWNDSGANVWLEEISEWNSRRISGPKADVQVSESSWDPSEAGVTRHAPCDGRGCLYTRSSLSLNIAALNTMTAFDRMKVIVHEFGHAIGLGHTEQDLTGSLSVMRQGQQPVNMPQAWDVSWVNLLYPPMR